MKKEEEKEEKERKVLDGKDVGILGHGNVSRAASVCLDGSLGNERSKVQQEGVKTLVNKKMKEEKGAG